jgi:hypothetical protein
VSAHEVYIQEIKAEYPLCGYFWSFAKQNSNLWGIEAEELECKARFFAAFRIGGRKKYAQIMKNIWRLLIFFCYFIILG